MKISKFYRKNLKKSLGPQPGLQSRDLTVPPCAFLALVPSPPGAGSGFPRRRVSVPPAQGPGPPGVGSQSPQRRVPVPPAQGRVPPGRLFANASSSSNGENLRFSMGWKLTIYAKKR